MPSVDGKTFRIFAQTEEDMKAAQIASTILEQEWPKYEERFRKVWAELWLNHVAKGIPLTDEAIAAAVRNVLPPDA
jgi:predicted NUDIX family NTP pyrophosphohydrolase